MNIGLAYDLKEDIPLGETLPEDALEEYDSLETVQGIEAALKAMGHQVIHLGGGRRFLVSILESKVDLVFNIAEGRGNYRSREAQVPAVLEMLGIPYVGSDPQCLAICLDKPLTKSLVAMAGVPTPPWKAVANLQQLERAGGEGWPLPAFIKPAFEGSSKGIRSGSRADTVEQAAGVVRELLESYCQPVIVEAFITGDEVTVGMVGNSPPDIIGIMRILPKEQRPDFVYSLEVKRQWESLVEYECPAGLGRAVLDRISELSRKIFEVLGCRDFARLDFRVARDGTPYFLEINPLAGLNSYSSDLPIMARKMGWTYPELIAAMVRSAIVRYPRCGPE